LITFFQFIPGSGLFPVVERTQRRGNRHATFYPDLSEPDESHRGPDPGPAGLRSHCCSRTIPGPDGGKFDAYQDLGLTFGGTVAGGHFNIP
jgi:hypothetical protein